MESKACRHLTVRLLYSDPEHMRILGKLDSLDTGVHKSKNQFIINAIAFYLEYLGEFQNDNTNNDSHAFVTRGELEERLKDQGITLRAELYEDLLKSILGASITSPVIRNNYQNENNIKKTGDISEKLNNCSDVLNSVMNWSED